MSGAGSSQQPSQAASMVTAPMVDRAAAPFRAMARLIARILAGPLGFGLTVVFVIAGIALFLASASGAFELGVWGHDVRHYLLATQRWIDTGSPYVPAEVAAPFQYQPMTFLHPPSALLLFAPFLVLPLPLWWVPLPIVAWSIAAWRPARWTWPIIALVLAYPRVHVAIILGNSDIWVWAAIALGIRYGWPAALIVIKPSVFPLLLVGARHRSFYVGLAVAALLCLPFGSLWIDWLHVAANSPAGLLYSILSLPWLLLPVLAYAARTTRSGDVPAREHQGADDEQERGRGNRPADATQPRAAAREDPVVGERG